MKRLFLLSGACFLFAISVFGQTVERTHTIVPEDYFSQIFLQGCEVSPDGQFTAFVDYRWDKETNGRFRDIWTVNNRTQELRRLTFAPGNEYSPQWSPEGDKVYFVGYYKNEGASKPPYDGSAQVWCINADGSELKAITSVPDGIQEYHLSSDGKNVFYTRSHEFMIDEWKDMRSAYRGDLKFGHGIHQVSSLWKLNLTTWRAEKIADPERYIQSFAVASDQKNIALITTPDDLLVSNEGESDVRIVELPSGKITALPDVLWRAEAPSPHGWLGGLAWSSKRSQLVFNVDFDGFPAELLLADFSNGVENAALRRLPRPEGVSISGNLRWTQAGNAVAFLGDYKARQHVYSVNVQTGAIKNHTPGDVVIGGFGFTGKKEALVAIQSELTYYHDLVLYSRPGKSTRLTHLNPQVDSWKLPQMSILKWVGAEGDTVEGILELPPDYDGKSKLPLLVNLHGGPTASEKYCFLFWIYGRASFASNGYAVLSPNYRGSTGYGDKFMTDLIGHENNYDVIDIMAGVDALIEKGIVDPERMGVSGWSNGGFLTNCLISTNRFKAASSGAGVFDMTVQLLEEDTPGHVINYMEGLPWEKPEEYQKASPLYSLKPGIETAVLIHVGEKDPRVPVTHSKGLHRMMTRYLDVPCELVIYPGAGHNLTKYTHRLAKMEWDRAWFDRYVLGK